MNELVSSVNVDPETVTLGVIFDASVKIQIFNFDLGIILNH